MNVQVNKEWYLEQMKKRIMAVDFQMAKDDVLRFIKLRDIPSIELWSTDFFFDRLEKLAAIL